MAARICQQEASSSGCRELLKPLQQLQKECGQLSSTIAAVAKGMQLAGSAALPQWKGSTVTGGAEGVHLALSQDTIPHQNQHTVFCVGSLWRCQHQSMCRGGWASVVTSSTTKTEKGLLATSPPPSLPNEPFLHNILAASSAASQPASQAAA